MQNSKSKCCVEQSLQCLSYLFFPLFFICFKKDYKLVTLQTSYDILELNVSIHLELPLEQS